MLFQVFHIFVFFFFFRFMMKRKRRSVEQSCLVHVCMAKLWQPAKGKRKFKDSIKISVSLVTRKKKSKSKSNAANLAIKQPPVVFSRIHPMKSHPSFFVHFLKPFYSIFFQTNKRLYNSFNLYITLWQTKIYEAIKILKTITKNNSHCKSN